MRFDTLNAVRRMTVAVADMMMTTMSALVILFSATDASASIAFAQEIAPFDSTSFTGYSPTQCVAAIDRAYQVATRQRIDTLRFAGPPVPPPIVRTTAQNCVAHLSVETADPRELIPLMYAYVTVGDSARRIAAFERRFAFTRTPMERAEALSEAITVYFSLPNLPLREKELAPLFAQLATIPGPAAKATRVELYGMAALAYIMLGTLDDNLPLRAADAAIAASDGLDSVKYPNAHIGLLNARGMREMILARRDTTIRPPLGVSAPLLRGELIVGAAGQRPAPGRFTLIVFQGATSRQNAAIMRRIKAEFGETLDIVFAGKTQGHFKGRGPYTFAEEAKVLTDYYTNVLRVPGAVVLEQREFTKRPDGRIDPIPTANDQAYFGAAVALVGADGRLRLLYPEWWPAFEIPLEKLLRTILQPQS